jgi:hypothetical protein
MLKNVSQQIRNCSKTAWIAVGDYKGKRIVGSSASNGARRWLAAARCKGSGQSERAAGLA